MDPASPSHRVPGAWPASPSSLQRRCHSIDSPRFRQHIPSLSPPKITPRRVTHSYFTSESKPILATPTAENTPTSFVSDLSLQSSPANTSVSSAYMSPFLEHTPSKTDRDKLLQYQTMFGRRQSLLIERGISTYCESPSPPGDSTFLSLPEIPDLSSTSSLQEDIHATSDSSDIFVNGPSYLSSDKNIRASSWTCESIDSLSSSSIRFRPTEVPRLEWDTEALRPPQPNSRNPWTQFLSPISAPLGDRSSLPLRPTWTPSGVRMSESECQSTDPTRSRVRRSWIGGNNLPGPTNELSEEEASTRRYASEVLDHAFRMDADISMFTLGVPGVNPSSDVPPLKVVSNPQRRVRLSHIAKRFVHRFLNNSRLEGTISERAASDDSDPEPVRNSRWSRDPSEKEESKLQVQDSPALLQYGGAPGPSSQDTQGGPELRVREYKLGGIKIGRRSAVSSTAGTRVRYPITPSLQHLSAFVSEKPKLHRTTSENQHFLNRDIFKLEKPKGNHRRSFLHRIGV